MPYMQLGPTDSLQTMIDHLKNFETYLPHIHGSYSNNVNQYRTYSDDHCIVLGYQLKQLAGDIETDLSSLKKQSKNSQHIRLFEMECKRVLLATYNAVLNPTEITCRQLDIIADEVSGHGSTWAKVGLVLKTVVGFLLGILPGFIYAIHHAKQDTWAQNSQNGLSSLTKEMNHSIEHTGAPYTGRTTTTRVNASKFG